MKEAAAKTPSKPAVLSLAQLLTEQPAAPPPGWIEPGLLPPAGILFVGGEPKVGKSLLVAGGVALILDIDLKLRERPSVAGEVLIL